MIRLFFLGGALALALPLAPAFAEGPAPLALSEKEIAVAFVRRPSGNGLDPVYRANMLRVTESFDRALRDGIAGGSGNGSGDFSAWFAEQHRLAVLGTAPGTFYWPEENTRKDGVKIPAHIGVAEAGSGVYRHLRRDQAPGEFLTQEVKLGAETLSEIATRTANRPPRTITIGPGIPYSYHFPVVDGIPTAALPRYTVSSVGGVKYDYPPAKFVPLYVAEMAASFGRLRAMLAGGSVDQEAALGELARFYHLAMIGHPFMRVNNSLLMAEVNVVLKRLGMKPVPHGDLDYVVRSLDSDGARAAFLGYVRAAQ